MTTAMLIPDDRYLMYRQEGFSLSRDRDDQNHLHIVFLGDYERMLYRRKIVKKYGVLEKGPRW